MWSVPEVAPTDVVFLTGAGISANAPTNGPIGYELTIRALTHAFLPETLAEARRAYAALGLDGDRMPRLEAILEIAARVHGADILDDLLEDLQRAEPNDLHRFFAGHAALGGLHATANFDAAIERAGPHSAVLHFHGSLSAGTTGLGATLSRIERGFSDEIRTELETLLTGASGRTLIVAGYSGLDFFDMDPFIAANADMLGVELAEVVWIDHDHSAGDGVFTEMTVSGPPMLTTLARSGVACTRVRARTDSLLNVLADRWGLPGLAPQHRDGVRWRARTKVKHADRAEATRRLYMHMGMYGSHAHLLEQHAQLHERVGPGDRAAIAWEQGRHREARREWRKLYSGPGSELRARRLERAAACTWDAGAYMRAYVTALRAVRVARASNNKEILALCLELQARILVHMGRLPDLRWFATSRRRRRVADQLLNVVSANAFGSGVRPRLLDAVELVLSDPESRGATSEVSSTADLTAAWSESYTQYESLSGTLNFRRGEMRRAVAHGGAEMSRGWLDDYQRSAEFLGKQAAVYTLPLLPGAASHFGWIEGVRCLLRARATPWHRARLVVLFAVRRATNSYTIRRHKGLA